MLREEIGKWFRRVFSKGANTDIEGELLGDDQWIDAKDMRPTSVDGHVGSLEKIGGATTRSRPPADELPVALAYNCIGACNVTGHEVSFWASINATADPEGFPVIIKINGTTMVKSSLIPYRWDRPLQFGDVSECKGGTVFPADHNAEPLFWDIPAIVAAHNAGSTEYTTGFDLDRVTVALATPMVWPLHTGNPSIGTGARPGQYEFRLRYVTPGGDKTNFSPATPLISVPRTQAPIYWAGLSPDNFQYPGAQTTGSEPAGTDDIPTPFGIALEWQVDNVHGYSQAELVVTRYNEGDGLEGNGVTEVIARIAMTPNQFSLQPFVYPRDNNFFELIPVDESVQEQLPIDAPKTVEYTDNRVVYGNFRLKSRITDIVYRAVNGLRAVAITNHLFTRWNDSDYEDGFSDPRNNTYFKSAQHNERYGLGLMLWDNASARAPVSEIVQSFQFPDRRDRKAGESLALSFNKLSPFGQVVDPIYAANNECQGDDPVSPTFDAIRQGTVRKYDDTFVNVKQSDGASYSPWAPINPSAEDFVRFRQMPIRQWNTGSQSLDETGHVFSPQHHTLGAAIYGPQNLDETAPWWKAFSIMRTDPANRVIAEGIGVYNLVGIRAKSSDMLNCHFPDVDSGVVPQGVWEDVVNNPQNYKLKLTPFGFKSEIYSYQPITSPVNASQGIDLISYCDVQFDNGIDANAPQWSVNPGEPAGGMGYQPTFSAPAAPTNYVGPSAWRSDPPPQYNTQTNPNDANQPDYSPFMDEANAAQGNFLFDIAGVGNVPEGRGEYWRIQTQQLVYPSGWCVSGAQFGSPGTRRFHNPVYIVQVIRDGADVPAQNQQPWKETSERILREHTIAIAPGGQQPFAITLRYARPNDCVPVPVSGENRYVWIREQGQPDKAFLCFTNSSGIDFAAAQAAYASGGTYTTPDGTVTYGAYEYTSDSQTQPHIQHILNFNGWGSFVPAGARIIVKYDKNAPIQAFGFDRTIANSIFCPLDRQFRGDQPSQSTQLLNNPPLPYTGGIRSDNYILPFGDNTANVPTTIDYINGIRQWAVMAHIVTKTPYVALTQSENYPGAAFPRRHYVIRPVGAAATSISTSSGEDNGFYPEYDNDFPNEAAWFDRGGFQFRSNYNLDYAKQPNVSGIGIPRDGQFAVDDYCTGFAASDRNDPRQSDAPGLRTFRWDNVFVASTENGELKRMHLLNNNLTGLFERGVAMIPNNKATLTDADGNTVATQSIGNFWPRPGGEIWLTRGAMGSPNQMWRIAAKHTAPNGSEVLIWADRNGFYRTTGRGIEDISRNKRNAVLLPLLRVFPQGYEGNYAAVYDTLHAEHWSQMGGTQVFSTAMGQWTGFFSYDYDTYQCLPSGQVVGYRGLYEYNLNSGFILNGQPVEGWAEVFFAPTPGLQSELVAWRVNPDKPDELRIYDRSHAQMLVNNEQVQEAADPGTGPLWVMNIDGWQQMMNSTDPSYSPDIQPPQATGFYMRVHFNRPERQRITFASVQGRPIP